MGKGPSKKYKPGIGHQEKTPSKYAKGPKLMPDYDWEAFEVSAKKSENAFKSFADAVSGIHDSVYLYQSGGYPVKKAAFPKKPSKVEWNFDKFMGSNSISMIKGVFNPHFQHMVEQDVPDGLKITFSFQFAIEQNAIKCEMVLTDGYEGLHQQLMLAKEEIEDAYNGPGMKYKICAAVKMMVQQFSKGNPAKTVDGDKLYQHILPYGAYPGPKDDKIVTMKVNNLASFPPEVQMPAALAKHLQDIFDPYGGDVTYGEDGMVTVMMGEQVSHVETTAEEDWGQIHNTVVNVAIGLRQNHGLPIDDWMYKDPKKKV